MRKVHEAIWHLPDFGEKVPDSSWYKLLFSLQDTFIKASFEFYTQNNLSYVPLPVTTGSISSPMGLGSDSTPVRIKLKDKTIYLADSMQFLLEYSCRIAEKGAFYLMPSFRGEPTDERHLSQFFHSEAELKGDLPAIIRFVNAYLAYLSKRILEKHAEDILDWAGTTKHLEYMAGQPDIVEITYERAVQELEAVENAFDILEGNIKCINKTGEKMLMKHYGGYVWLTNFDERVVPFYQASENGYAKNADLLMGIGEVAGAGERCVTGDAVCASLERHGVSKAEYEWYIKMKSLTPLQTSGFGMGMERFLLWVLNHDDIRDMQIISRIDGSLMQP